MWEIMLHLDGPTLAVLPHSKPHKLSVLEIRAMLFRSGPEGRQSEHKCVACRVVDYASGLHSSFENLVNLREKKTECVDRNAAML